MRQFEYRYEVNVGTVAREVDMPDDADDELNAIGREDTRIAGRESIPLGAPPADQRGLPDALEDTFPSVLQQPT